MNIAEQTFEKIIENNKQTMVFVKEELPKMFIEQNKLKVVLKRHNLENTISNFNEDIFDVLLRENGFYAVSNSSGIGTAYTIYLTKSE